MAQLEVSSSLEPAPPEPVSEEPVEVKFEVVSAPSAAFHRQEPKAPIQALQVSVPEQIREKVLVSAQ